ncbi:cell division suppressor protein YneA [Lederbergia panacisoli]|uniref:cell division suppressor protein YneA n=1 Tax=Lederbergia panacisoli TaxID=1255251 RepID=UPI00214B9AC8|nr:LysM peptidoglycan-binding domain-containing protein [Lederbergia panacisoli]MCR2820620.1 LysM peptidoglycan-binding domain-containing protein [Lederbergia panacisoli]
MVAIWKKYSYAILFFIITLLMGFYILFSGDDKHHTDLVITVQKGDTLWSISQKNAERYGMSTTDFMKILEKENQLKSTSIKNGDELIISGSYLKFNDDKIEYAYKGK